MPLKSKIFRLDPVREGTLIFLSNGEWFDFIEPLHVVHFLNKYGYMATKEIEHSRKFCYISLLFSALCFLLPLYGFFIGMKSCSDFLILCIPSGFMLLLAGGLYWDVRWMENKISPVKKALEQATGKVFRGWSIKED